MSVVWIKDGALPCVFDPQHSTIPLDTTAHVWKIPAATEAKVLTPSEGLSGVVGAWPYEFHPQHSIVPRELQYAGAGPSEDSLHAHSGNSFGQESDE